MLNKPKGFREGLIQLVVVKLKQISKASLDSYWSAYRDSTMQ